MLFLVVAAAAAAAAPAPCTQHGWDKLLALVGKWTVPFTFRTAPGQFEQGVARSHVRFGPVPCTIVDELRGTKAGKPVAFLSVITISPTAKIERIFMDSEHGRLLHYEGELDGSLAGLSLDYPPNPRFRARAELDLSNPKRPRITHLLSMDDGRSWQPVLIFRYRR
jgi:hypothetical protein